MGAIEAVTQEGRALTPDLGGTATTTEVATAVCEQIGRLAK
jgi:isocitrate/isopropylmalate dehydrogenase